MFDIAAIQGVDLDVARRPGYPGYRPVEPWPNTRYPPVQQPGEPASLVHGRPGKTVTPVFGTAVPPSGLSGAMRRLAHRFPDHEVRHWLILLAADRVQATGPRLRRLVTWGLPVMVAGAGVLATRRKGEREEQPREPYRPWQQRSPTWQQRWAGHGRQEHPAPRGG